ncbi:hypothetical protein EDD21DRAFT_357506 [Dissophora ornata]|nr:hypothetical protein BGZ58_011150 [Dissophora ornata]KAI8597165.1 hypothetical protein EDD21DRAFT_357506 [Dissophora ornata]
MPVDKHAVSKYFLMKTYGVSTPEVITPQWVEAYDSEREKHICKNLRTLRAAGEPTMEDIPEGLRQREYLTLRFCAATQAPHKLADSQFTKLQYAADIMVTCGFTDVFASDRVQAQTLKDRVDVVWDTVKGEMGHICMTLSFDEPTHSN